MNSSSSSSHQLIEEFNDMPGDFGRSIPTTGLKLYAVAMDDNDEFGCNVIYDPPHFNYPKDSKFCIIIKRFLSFGFCFCFFFLVVERKDNNLCQFF